MPQIRSLRDRSPTFTLTGPDMAPRGKAWDSARPADRRAYWPMLAAEVYRVKQRELAAGLDHAGNRLARIKPSTWERRRQAYRFSPGGWQGPPLTPQNEFSRTRRLLQVRMSQGDRVVGYWPRWGRVLGYHARGEVRGAPSRDVIGLSPRGRREAARAAVARWQAEVAPRVEALRVFEAPVAVEARRPSDRAIARAMRDRVRDLVEQYPQLGEFAPSVPGDPSPPPTPTPPPTPPARRPWWRRLATLFGSLFG